MPQHDRRQLRITWSDELLTDFWRYHASVNPHGSPSDTLREMVQAQLASDPKGGLHAAIRHTVLKSALSLAHEVVREGLRNAVDNFNSRMPEVE